MDPNQRRLLNLRPSGGPIDLDPPAFGALHAAPGPVAEALGAPTRQGLAAFEVSFEFLNANTSMILNH